MPNDRTYRKVMEESPALAKIRNVEDLVTRGDSASRRLVLDITDRTLARLDAYLRIKSIAHRSGPILTVGERTWDLASKRDVYLVGAGKACNHMARAVDEILGDYLTRGVIIVKLAEQQDVYGRTEAHVGGHPIPDRAGYEASLKILEIVDGCGPEDLVIGVISGGSSALMNCPVDGISLAEEVAATDVLLRSGASIGEINAVRRHISQTNGGRLAQRIAATGAEFIGFAISDAVGKQPTGDIGVPDQNYQSTPIGPDPTTLADARRCLHDYDLIDRLPASLVKYLTEADETRETPKAFPDNTYFLLNTVADSCIYAQEVADEIGVPAVILTSFLEGEAKDAGRFLAAVAREIQTNGHPVPAPCVILAAGEVTTKILDESTIAGHGGPGQEVAIGFALAAGSVPGACVLSIDTEGTDGTTPAAGGLADSTTVQSAQALGVDLHAALRGHATYEALAALQDVVVTGNTGTNLCDLHILYIPSLPCPAD